MNDDININDISITFLVDASSADLETGDVNVAWPTIDARGEKLEPAIVAMRRELAKAFICGYRIGRPDATDDDVRAAVIQWASK